jgi:hypothetical protein
VKALTISGNDRRIIYVSNLFGGKTHDYTMMKTEFDTQTTWFNTIDTLADLGFLGANRDYGQNAKIVLPHKKPRNSKNNPAPQLSDEQKHANQAHAKRRVIVEHAIGGMKHFHCLSHRVRNQSMSLIDQFLGVAAGLWNFKIA